MFDSLPTAPFRFCAEVIVRPCRQADLPALEWMGLYEGHRALLADAFARQQNGCCLMLLGLCSEFPVAQIFIDLPEASGSAVAHFWAVRTFFPLQGLGIGRQMLGRANMLAASRGCDAAELEVASEDERAQHFYRRSGFAAVRHASRADGLVLMRKRLDDPEPRFLSPR